MFLLYTYIKTTTNSHFSDKRNENLKLIPCDVRLQTVANNVVPNFDDVTLCKHVQQSKKLHLSCLILFFNAEKVIKANCQNVR